MDKLLIAGIVCVIAAIVGGGLKAFGVEMPILKNPSRQLSLGAFGLLLLGIAFFSGLRNPGGKMLPPAADAAVANVAVADVPAADVAATKDSAQLPVEPESQRIAGWVDHPQIAVAPTLLHCGCLDADSREGESGAWERLSSGSHGSRTGTKIRFSNQCPTSIQLFAVRDTVPEAMRVPMMRATAGRSYALESLKTGESVVFDPYQGGQAMVVFMPTNCPPEFAKAVPLACVSDARLTPALAPGGPPMVCDAQGPPNTVCSCNGRAGINFLGDVAPYP